MFENQGNINDAKAYYQLTVKTHPHHTLAFNNLGVIYCREGKYSEGIRQLKQAVKNSPHMANPHYNLGMAYYYIGDMESALNSFEQALKIEPTYPPHINFNISCVLARLNRLDESLEMLRCALCRGYSNIKQIHTDPDLEPIRSLPEFSAVMEYAQKNSRINPSDCCQLLK